MQSTRYGIQQGAPKTSYIQKIQAKLEKKKTQPVKMPKQTDIFGPAGKSKKKQK